MKLGGEYYLPKADRCSPPGGYRTLSLPPRWCAVGNGIDPAKMIEGSWSGYEELKEIDFYL